MCEDRLIQVVSGDSVDKAVEVTAGERILTDADIESLHFTCSGLGFDKILDFDAEEKCFLLWIAPEETAAWECGVYEYDLTVYTTGRDVHSGVYMGTLQVCPKINRVIIDEM